MLRRIRAEALTKVGQPRQASQAELAAEYSGYFARYLRHAIGSPGEANREDMLKAAVLDVIAGPDGDFIRSHGGVVDLVGVSGDTALVRLSGACENCPSLGFTLHGRLERAARKTYPQLERLQLQRPRQTPG